MSEPRDVLSASDLPDESPWTKVTPDHELMAQPSELPPELIDPAPDLLNTHELRWEAFEKLIYRMARDEGALNTHLYGDRGQAQHGIDIVAFPHEGRPTVYQAKRQQEFLASDLEEAVERYASDHHLNAQRIVVAVACKAHSTEVIDMLQALRRAHGDLQIELWDRVEISERLRIGPEIVRVFFGNASAERFCSAAAATFEVREAPVPADAVLRGPIAHLGLTGELQQAQAAVDQDPSTAAAGFSAIAERLEASAFVGYAVRLRRQQARALRAAGSPVESCRIHLDLGWSLLDAGDPFSARNEVREIDECAAELPDQIMRAAQALSAAAGVRYDHSVSLEDLASAFDDLHIEDPHRLDVALVLSEEAVADRRPAVVSLREDALQVIAAEQPVDEAGQAVAARLRMCLADCGGDWDGLAAGARRHYSQRLAAWILARHARHLALAVRPEESIERWFDAIERACNEGLFDDAADWLYALREVKVKYGHMDENLDDLHRSAMALRASGSGTVLPEPYSARERALAALRDEKWPDALEALRRYVWRSTIGASLGDELEAHRRLGDLYVATGRPAEAVRHMIIAGDQDGLRDLARTLPDEPARMAADLLPQTPWERGAAFKYVGAVADLLIDDDAREWASLALQELLVTSGRPTTPFSDDALCAAYEAFGELAQVISKQEAEAFLGLAHDLAAGELGVHPFTGDGHVKALLSIARSQPSLQRVAATRLLDELLGSPRVRNLVLGAADVLCGERAAVEERLVGPASEGVVSAALGLVVAEGDATVVVPMAERCLARFAHPRERVPGHYHIGTGATDAALLVTVLEEPEQTMFARHMLREASDLEEITVNRAEYLLALTPLAKTLPDDMRTEVFESVMTYARGEHDGEELDSPFFGAVDPLSRFRLRFGPDSLAPSGLQVAAAVASAPDEYAAVETTALAMLPDADDRTCRVIAWALASIPDDHLSVDLSVPAAHESAWLRAFAATAWCKREDANDDLGKRLVRDPSGLVRRSLASGLRDLPAHEELRTILSLDPRRSIRRKVAI